MNKANTSFIQGLIFLFPHTLLFNRLNKEMYHAIALKKKILTSCITHKVQRQVISWFICLVLFASCNILSCSSSLATDILSPQSNCCAFQVGLCISDQIFTLYLPFLDILYQCASYVAYVSFVQCLKDELVDSPDFQCAG